MKQTSPALYCPLHLRKSTPKEARGFVMRVFD
jgi:hypothetical protein